MERLDDYNYQVKNKSKTEKDEKTEISSTIETASLRNELYNAYINQSLSYDDVIKLSKIITDESVYLDKHNHTTNPVVYNRIYDKLKSKGYEMNGMTRMSETSDLSMISKVVSEMQREMKKIVVSEEELNKFYDNLCDGTFKNKRNVIRETINNIENDFENLINDMENL